MGNFLNICKMFIFKECNEGQFGQNCDFECGHCLHKKQCHYIEGTCSSGCDDGYRGIQCKKSKYINTAKMLIKDWP